MGLVGGLPVAKLSGWLARDLQQSGQSPSTSGPVHLSLLQPCGPKQAPRPAREVSSTHAKHLGSLPGIPCLAEGAVYGCGLMGFPISKERCYFCSSARSHKPSFSKSWLEPQHKKKACASISLITGETETCASAQCLVDTTARVGSTFCHWLEHVLQAQVRRVPKCN